MLNLWTTEQFEIICESSLLPPVSQFLKECKERPEGRKREGRPCSISQGWHLKYTTRQWVALIHWEQEPQGPEHPSTLMLPCLGSGFWPQRSYSFQRCSWHLERGCSSSHRPLSSPRASHTASSHNSATVTKAPQQLWLLPSLLSPATFLKEDLKGAPDMWCRYQPLKHCDRVHWSKYMIESI